jgi:hypothetical protein
MGIDRTMRDFWQRWKRLIGRVLLETALPSAAAFVWGVWSYSKSPNLFASFSAAGLAFGFLLFAQGQLLRMAKNVRDEDDANEFRNSFATIGQALEELRRQQVEDATALRNPLNRSGLFEPEANSAVAQGFYKAGAALAAIEFERTLKEIAMMLDINPRQSLTLVSDAIAKKLGRDELREELRTLGQIRNSLIHSKFLGPGRKAEAEEIVQGFQDGIRRVHATLPHA